MGNLAVNVHVVGNLQQADEDGLLALVTEVLPGAIYLQSPAGRVGDAPNAIISTAIGANAFHILVAKVFASEEAALKNLAPLARAAQSAHERSEGRFNPLVLAPIQRGGEKALARIVYCPARGWVARYYEDERVDGTLDD